MSFAETQCLIAYEQLKFDARLPKFQFSMLLEKKNYETYLEALSQLRDGLYPNHNIVLGHLILILDFELAIQQALRQAFFFFLKI